MSDKFLAEAIDTAWKESGGEWKKHEDALRRIMAEWSLAQLVGCAITMQDLSKAAFTPAIYNAAFMLWDGALGEDGFLDFTDALTVTPEHIYQEVLHDADSLIDVPELWSPSSSCFWMIPYTVYDRQKRVKQRTHLLADHLPLEDDGGGNDLWEPLKGHPNRQVAKELLPRIYTRFGEMAFEGR